MVAHYTRRKANIREPSILIRINKLYRYGMSDVELYDATRSAWKIGPKRERAFLALPVFEGVVREDSAFHVLHAATAAALVFGHFGTAARAARGGEAR